LFFYLKTVQIQLAEVEILKELPSKRKQELKTSLLESGLDLMENTYIPVVYLFKHLLNKSLPE
jgi:hypothetical protein